MFRALGHVLLFTPLLISGEETEAQWLSDLCHVQGCRRWCRDMNPSRPIHVPSHHPLQPCHVTRWAQTCWQLQGGCGASPCPRPGRLALHQPAWWHWLNSWRRVGSEEEFSVGLLYAWFPPFSLNRELVQYCVCECGWLLCNFSENVPARLAEGCAQYVCNKSVKPTLPWFELHPLVKVVGRQLATCLSAWHFLPPQAAPSRSGSWAQVSWPLRAQRWINRRLMPFTCFGMCSGKSPSHGSWYLYTCSSSHLFA